MFYLETAWCEWMLVTLCLSSLCHPEKKNMPHPPYHNLSPLLPVSKQNKTKTVTKNMALPSQHFCTSLVFKNSHEQKNSLNDSNYSGSFDKDCPFKVERCEICSARLLTRKVRIWGCHLFYVCDGLAGLGYPLPLIGHSFPGLLYQWNVDKRGFQNLKKNMYPLHFFQLKLATQCVLYVHILIG